ncbi:MAG: ATP phosphoribosyltransferase [Eubacterium sp.]|jgi:ATP phosphoribosyltransferase|uniref:ATP phosphoribosyltransferase n=1 Tax=Eubacterium sp. F2 TaxID=3381348 RepID=UPI0039082E77|nr:ATP phosphoribosyltransferase [Eubacterium sp.]MCI2196722.1 ATP phosphoribosyltransferase [Eubacterium sp.]
MGQMLRVALPKGRLGDQVYDMLERCGYECPEIKDGSRKLIFTNEEKGVQYFQVKPTDVVKYVERGAADLGIAGRDILLEYESDVYELLDLKIGKCRMCVAGPNGFHENPEKRLVVATKFKNIAGNYFAEQGRDIDLIKLHGSIELAPIVGLSDVIVDIVETGNTLRENNLKVLETIIPISARLIANKASFQFKTKEIETMRDALAEQVEKKEAEKK